MSTRPIDIPRLHPTARTIAVTSGKGGAAKTTTAVALAARLATDGHNTVLVDMDVPAPNAAIIADVADVKLRARPGKTEIVLPESPLGFRVATPTSFKQGASFEDMTALPLWANNIDVIVYDLPGGWTRAQETVMGHFVDVIVAVSPPTDSALSDHAAHVRHLLATVPANEQKVRDRDKRRKVEFPETRILTIETLAEHLGTLPNGKVAKVRRIDAVPADEARSRVEPDGTRFVTSIPPAVDVKALSETDEVGVLAAEVLS